MRGMEVFVVGTDGTIVVTGEGYNRYESLAALSFGSLFCGTKFLLQKSAYTYNLFISNFNTGWFWPTPRFDATVFDPFSQGFSIRDSEFLQILINAVQPSCPRSSFCFHSIHILIRPVR